MATLLAFQRRLPGTTWVLVVSAFFLATSTMEGGVIPLVVALVFYSTCPGMVVVDWFGLDRLAERVAFGVGASLSLNLTSVTLLLAVDRYSADLMAVVTATLNLIAVLVTSAQAWRLRSRVSDEVAQG